MSKKCCTLPVVWVAAGLAVTGLLFFSGCPNRVADSPGSADEQRLGERAVERDDATQRSEQRQRQVHSIPLDPPDDAQRSTDARYASRTDVVDGQSEQRAGAPSILSQDDQPLLAQWEQPDFVLFVTGRQDGWIEPCGCSGLDNQKGGLARRHTFYKQLEQRGWPLISLDVGNQVRRFGRQPEIKFQRTVDALKTMQYQSVALGPDDLRLSVNELFATIVSDNGDGPFVSANVALLDESFMPRYRVVEAGSKRIGITSILGDAEAGDVASDEVLVRSVEEGLTDAWNELQAADCDFYVLLAHTSLEESKAVARRFPHFDLVVTAGGVGEPTLTPESIEGTSSQMIQVGTKGMYVGVVGVFDGELRYERVGLSHDFEDSDAMTDLMVGYQDQLKALGLDGLGLQPIPHPSGRQFVGTQTCAQCHTTAHAKWEQTPHGHATDSLSYPNERVEILRHYDPECLSCHVTGWNPQQYYPYSSGYLSLVETPIMKHNGCENCHGPGSAHVAAEWGEEEVSLEEKLARREQMILPLDQAERKCMECHDLDNSPDFHVEGAFEEYWKQIEHYGKY